MINKDINRVRVSEATDWIKESFQIMLTGGLFFFLILPLIGYAFDHLLPLVGADLYFPLRYLGYSILYLLSLYVAYCADTSRAFDINDFFDVIREKAIVFLPLVLLLVGTLAIFIYSDKLVPNLNNLKNILGLQGMESNLILGLFNALLFLSIIMAVLAIFIWLPIPLILFNHVSVIDAVKLGLKASWHNFGVIFVSQLLFYLISRVCAMIPFAGFLVPPLFIALTYVTYKRSLIR